MGNRVIVFGVSEDVYTRMVCYHLEKKGVNFDCMVVGGGGGGAVNKISFFSKLKALLSSGAFKGVKTYNPFLYYLCLERLLAKRNARIASVYSAYDRYSYEPDFSVADIGSNEVLDIIDKNDYDYALFGGVGIVPESVIKRINRFCLNAHPAPLPECRGGGALECTLYKNLKPAVSVHIATAGIDEGSIVSKVELDFLSHKDFGFQFISARLTEKCAMELADTIKRILDNKEVIFMDNGGRLNYWRDWGALKQIRARYNLLKMKRGFRG